jgi:hypothetical protein
MTMRTFARSARAAVSPFGGERGVALHLVGLSPSVLTVSNLPL